MGIRERKLREYENRRQLILSTARKLFSVKGFAHVTLEDIAKEIEFSKGTIYSHFASKEEIYVLLLSEILEQLLDILKESVCAAKDTRDGIKKCIDAYLQFYIERREYFRLLFFIDLYSDQSRIDSKLMKDIQYLKIQCLFVLQQFVQQGIRSGEIQTSRSARKVAMVLWGMANGIFQLVETKQVNQKDLHSLIDVGFDIVVNGLTDNKTDERRN